MTPAIETTALTKRFKSIRTYRELATYAWRRTAHVAVDSLTLQVGQGEVFGVLGQNGAGKTTLVRMLTTALAPSSGSARVLGHDIVGDQRRVRELIGVVAAEERSFFPRLTGRENLEFFAALFGMRPAVASSRIDELLGRVGLTEAAGRAFLTYSSGMRQKLAVARGLLGDPQILFLDEPTRALDPISAREVRRLVREFVADRPGRTVVLATNLMAEAEELCDRVALIRRGQLMLEGTVDELRVRLRYGVHCELRLPDVPAGLPDRLRVLPGVLELSTTPENGLTVLRMTLVEEGPVLAAVLRETVDLDGQVYSCTTRKVSLEDIYVEQLGEPSRAPEAAPC